MGFFDKLKQKSDNFFDSLQQNAIDKALTAARGNNQKDDSVNKIKNLQNLYDNASEEEKENILEKQYKNWFESTNEIERNSQKMRIILKSAEASGIENIDMESILTPLEKRIRDGSKEEHEKAMQAADERVKKLIAADKERLDRLSSLYNEEDVNKIINKELWLGMTEEMLLEVKGKPQDISENVSKGVVKKKHYYDKSTNRLGNDSFDFEVTLEDGKVTGWKDRRNRGTRDI